MTNISTEQSTRRWFEGSRFEFGLIAVWIFLAILAIFVDLELSEKVFNPDSMIGVFTADYGEVPGFILIITSLIIVLLYRPMNHYYVISGLIITYIVGYLTAVRLVDNLIFELILAAIIPAIIFLIVWRLVNFHHHYIVKASGRTVKVALIVPTILVGFIKYFWGRVRFRDLNQDYSNYSPWFIPQGITANRSFPSGHAAMGWMLVCLIFFVKDRNKRLIVGIITTIWAVIVSWGRVIIGAHYLSDITFSTGFAVFTINYYYNKQKLLLDEETVDL